MRVAPDLNLVSADHVYAGWILSHPADHPVREWEPAPSMPAPAGTASVLRDCLATVVEPKIDRMQDGDPSLLRHQMIGLRDKWYGDM